MYIFLCHQSGVAKVIGLAERREETGRGGDTGRETCHVESMLTAGCRT